MASDSLFDIVRTLDEADRRAFSAFIHRSRSRRARKDVELFELLCREKAPTAEAAMQQLYGTTSKVGAYHALRKRLMDQLLDFLVLKQMEQDSSASGQVMGLLSLARYLFERDQERQAWKYLLKSERIAGEHELFGLLNSIYDLQVQHSGSEFGRPLDEVVERWKSNKQLADEDERANIGFAMIRERLQAYRQSGQDTNFDEVVIDVLDRFQLTDAIAQRPKILFQVMSMVRSGIIARKEYHSFEPFIIGQYQAMEAAQGFGRSSHYYKLSLLYMIAHVLYRNKRFERAVVYLEMLRDNLEQFGRVHRSAFLARYGMLLAACKVYVGENELAIQIQEEVLESPEVKLTVPQEFNSRLNLAVYYFQQDDFKKSNQLLLDFGHSDQWYAKKMGREWVLKKSLIELIVQYELGNDDLTENRIRSMERSFGDLFGKPIYQRVAAFLKFIRQMIADPAFVETEAYEKQVRATLVNLPREQEDLQAMAFYSWLKSKMVQKPYYEVLLEVANT